MTLHWTGTATEVDAIASDFRDLMTAVDAAIVATLNGYMNELVLINDQCQEKK